MLKHLWRSLIAVRRHARLKVSEGYGTVVYDCSGLAYDPAEIDAETAQRRLELAESALRYREWSREQDEIDLKSDDELRQMIVTLQRMIENIHAPSVPR